MDCVAVNIPSNIVFERVVRASADEIAQALGFSPERVEDLKLAVSEAVTNAIEHGNKNEASKSVEIVFVLDHEKLEIRITDQGSGIPSFDISRHVVEEQNLEKGMLRGFGTYLISTLVDDYEVNSSHTGTVLILRLYRKG